LAADNDQPRERTGPAKSRAFSFGGQRGPANAVRRGVKPRPGVRLTTILLVIQYHDGKLQPWLVAAQGFRKSQGVRGQKKFDCYFLTTPSSPREIESIDSQTLTLGAEHVAFRGIAPGAAAWPDSRACRAPAACGDGGASLFSSGKEKERRSIKSAYPSWAGFPVMRQYYLDLF